VICCDGLSAVVSPETFDSIARTQAPLEEVCKTFIAAAIDAGGPDNITVVMADVGPPDVV
jgi:serine/threonine protein phosphatase PrpC